MTKTTPKHTPSPWSTVATMSSDFRHSRLITDDQSRVLAETRYLLGGDNQAEELANARLIAAAPELLEALEFWFDSKATASEIARRARAAIAKATGETA